MRNFLLRALTSIVLLVGLVLAFIFLSAFGIIVFVSIITARLTWEYTQLVVSKPADVIFRWFLFGLCFLSYLCFAFNLLKLETAMVFTVYICVLCAFWLWQSRGAEEVLAGIGLILVSLFYVAWPAGLFLKMFLYEVTGPGYLLLLLCMVFTGDIMAYIGGGSVGKRKWLPKISPGKTWWGLVSGMSASGIVAVAGVFYDNGRLLITFERNTLSIIIVFSLGVACFFVAQTGDLFVSVLKRRGGVKDTGRLLPGHGGLLDRMDGLLMTLPFMYMMFLFLES